jgi:hypothetical protein
MRIFWWQGGLHIEPESPVETEAMLVLFHESWVNGECVGCSPWRCRLELPRAMRRLAPFGYGLHRR